MKVGTGPEIERRFIVGGNVNGCNANADAKVDAGDLSCAVRLLFESGGCAP